MEKMYDMTEQQERVILVAVNDCDDEAAVNESLDELAELVATAGAETAGRMVQNRDKIHPGTYVGTGKIEELKNAIEMLEATGIVCDDELSPAQLKNLEQELGTKVMDRTLIILDIFAKRATTKEGKIQVELAQLKYRAARLVGLRSSLSRLGGGIGTRGPGEKKLEIDRRLINDRIAVLRREVDELSNHRELAREKRKKNPIPVVAIVGYTNAGKSTLLNTMTNAGILEEDKLFATLDPTTRNYKLPGGQEILLTDTVGFIRKLPHHLIDAFRSTLEEAKYADIILHVIDSSNPQMDSHMEIVYETLQNLGVKDKPVITFFNKQDKLPEDFHGIFKDLKADYTIGGSIKQGKGLEKLAEILEMIIREQSVYVEKVIPYDQAGKIQLIRQYGQLLSEEYVENGISVKGTIPKELEGKI
ncbi:MAG: GTPase HflX [Lachnospiraceae bacterium]|nr:GTPase HflX [Lachnospiraceae bacterium]